MWTELNMLIMSLFTRAQDAQESLYARVQLAKEEGQTAVEYALVIGLVSVVIVGALALFKGKLEEFVKEINL